MNRFWLPGISVLALAGATSTLAQATTIGLCSVLLLSLHQALLIPLRRWLAGPWRLLASLLLLAALASSLQLGLQTWALPLAHSLGHYPALLCIQCLMADQLWPDGLGWRRLGLLLSSLLMLCILLGACRQWLATGVGVHLASLAPGGLMLLGGLLALYNRLRPGPAPSRRQGSL
ncbi:Rnf-Nqr domain containing protein [Pseudomonas putida]|uniref:NADH:quinone oxidoreductase n=1 Tax=Pseudomonas putida TaxID=303 RepID=A0A1X0ZYV9_PSEPU|nr:Rnf-Nqr domain containing protein [Pseudomonas putida]ORL64804.1 NADH:quinone oxidoreductase [Pseudomonas putida]